MPNEHILADEAGGDRWSRLCRYFSERYALSPDHPLAESSAGGAQKWLSLGRSLVEGSKQAPLREFRPGQSPKGLVLQEQAEGDIQWVVRMSEMMQPDPPVRVFISDDDDDRMVLTHTVSCVSAFAASYLFAYHWVRGFTTFGEQASDIWKRLAEECVVGSFAELKLIEGPGLTVVYEETGVAFPETRPTIRVIVSRDADLAQLPPTLREKLAK